LFAELATFAPYAGGISLAGIDLLETAHKRLRERWNDDELVAAFDEKLYEKIDATLNLADRAIEKIKAAVKGLRDSIGSKWNPVHLAEELTLTYLDDVGTVLAMLGAVFEKLGDERLATQAAKLARHTRDRKAALERETIPDLSSFEDPEEEAEESGGSGG
jgi:hypothetical protein